MTHYIHLRCYSLLPSHLLLCLTSCFWRYATEFKIFWICHYFYCKCRPTAVFWIRTVHSSRCLPPFGMNVICCPRLQSKTEARRMIFSVTLVTTWHRPEDVSPEGNYMNLYSRDNVKSYIIPYYK